MLFLKKDNDYFRIFSLRRVARTKTIVQPFEMDQFQPSSSVTSVGELGRVILSRKKIFQNYIRGTSYTS